MPQAGMLDIAVYICPLPLLVEDAGSRARIAGVEIEILGVGDSFV